MTDETRNCADVFGKAPWRHLMRRVLSPTAHVPTMLHREEQRLYYWLTAIWAQGVGDILDLGCFVGGSTARLAEGHRVSRLTSRIHAFDRFTADETLKEKMLYSAGIPEFVTQDILPLAENLLAPWAFAIDFHPGEIEDSIWDGDPIEILIIDAAKSTSTTDALADIFFPSLIAGQSIVVQQDFLHWTQPWICAQMELLADCFMPLAHCGDDTIVYLCTQTPDEDALTRARTSALSDDALIALVEQAATRLERFDCAARFDAMIAGIRHNPKERISWQFKKPPVAD